MRTQRTRAVLTVDTLAGQAGVPADSTIYMASEWRQAGGRTYILQHCAVTNKNFEGKWGVGLACCSLTQRL
jgi:hypothetical protein